MQVIATSRAHAGRIVAAALEYTLEVKVTDQSGTDPYYVVEFDANVVMNATERAEVAATV